MKPLLYILAAPMTALLGLAAFTAWWSALAFFSGIVVVSFVAVRTHEKHHRSEAYDDRMTDQRMEGARRWLHKDLESSDHPPPD